jgi:hypothetical protein
MFRSTNPVLRQDCLGQDAAIKLWVMVDGEGDGGWGWQCLQIGEVLLTRLFRSAWFLLLAQHLLPWPDMHQVTHAISSNELG